MKLQRIRVPLGFAFVLVYLYFCRPTWTSLAIGMIPALLGYLIRIWAAGHLYKWKGLAVSGPYAWTRNPLYLGSFVMGFGFMVASARISLVISFVILYILIYVPVMRAEEEELLAAYGDEFQEFRRKVPLFLPRFRRYGSGKNGAGFRWAQVVANREPMTGLGVAAVTLVLLAKLLW